MPLLPPEVLAVVGVTPSEDRTEEMKHIRQNFGVRLGLFTTV